MTSWRGAWPWAVAVIATVVVGCPSRRRRADVQRGTRADAAPAAKAKPTWATWPEDMAAARALVLARTVRRQAVAPRGTLQARLAQALARGPNAFIVGRRAIARAVGRTLGEGRKAWLLYGTFHDSGAQIAAFDWLVGAAGVGAIDAVSVEHLDADGRWSGLPLGAQRGENALVARAARGEATALWRSQRARDYTAWKYGYIAQVLRLVSTTRGSGAKLVPCDMSRALQRRVPMAKGEAAKIDGAPVADRLRELHCLQSLRDIAPKARRVAMQWGQAHLADRALMRFVDARDVVVAIDAFGARPAEIAPETEVGRGLALLAPTLVIEPTACSDKSCPRRAMLLLPGRHLAGRLERARDPLDKSDRRAASGRCSALLRTQRDATLRLRDKTLTLRRGKPLSISLRSGRASFLLQSKGTTIVGALELPDRGQLIADFDPRRRAAKLWIRPLR